MREIVQYDVSIREKNAAAFEEEKAQQKAFREANGLPPVVDPYADEFDGETVVDPYADKFDGVPARARAASGCDGSAC